MTPPSSSPAPAIAATAAAAADFDAGVAAVLVAAGVANAEDVARALHEEEFDLDTLRMCSLEDVEEFGIVEAATFQRIQECLVLASTDPPAAPPPKPPPDLCCPITKELFIDPVLCMGDGETYEREAIERHIRDKQATLEKAQKEFDDTDGASERARRTVAEGITSPMGHGTLESTALAPARMAKRMADDWRKANE